MPARRYAVPLAALLTLGSIPTLGAAAQQTTLPQDRLWDAAIKGDTVVLAQALADGAAIDSLDTRQNPNGRRALNWAAWYDHPEAIRFLLAHGAQINLANRTGFTPLHHAAENGCLGAAQALLAASADREAKNRDGETPAEVARRLGNRQVADAIEAAANAP